MKKIRLLPAFVTLLAGAITSITLYLFKVDTLYLLIILLAVLLIFYVLGVVAMKMIIDSAPQKEEEADENEGEVIEKDDEQFGKAGEKTSSDTRK